MTASVPSAPGYGGTTYYQYDSRNEIIQEQGPATGAQSKFAYDPAGDPSTFRGQTVGTANAANQLPGTTYDPAGNPAGYNGSALAFDAEDRLTSLGTVLTAGYRGDGLRAWKQNSAGTTYFLYSGTLLVCEMNASGAATAVNTSGPAGLLSRHPHEWQRVLHVRRARERLPAGEQQPFSRIQHRSSTLWTNSLSVGWDSGNGR